MQGSIRCYKCHKAKEARAMVCACGNPTFFVSVFWKGKHYRFARHFQTGDTMNSTGAERMLTAIRNEIDARTFEAEEWLPQNIKERRFENKIEAWLEIKKTETANGELSPGTLKAYSGFVKNHYSFFKGRDVKDIRTQHLEDFKDELGKKGVSIKTRRNALYALHHFFQWLHRRGAIQSMPVFPTVKGDDSKPRIAIDYGTQTAALDRIPEQHRDILLFTMETGLRGGEVTALKLRDLDLSCRKALIQRTWTCSQLRETTKGKNKRWIPLSSMALDIASRHARGKLPEAFLFMNSDTGRHYTVKALNLIWRNYSGVSCTFYEASRHSFCTQLIEDGHGIAAVKELARHSDIRTTQKYLHTRTETFIQAVENRGRGQILPLKKANMNEI